MKPTRESVAERFWSHVQGTPETDCWRWTAGKDWDGYGIFSDRGESRRAHRWSYEHLVGPIPNGLQLDHLCRVRDCVNPEHLEPVTSRINTMRGDTLAAANAARTQCVEGHPLNDKRRCPVCAVYFARTHKGWSDLDARSVPIAPAPSEREECPQGHPYSPENTYMEKGRKRKCRTCHRDRQRAYYHAKKEKS